MNRKRQPRPEALALVREAQEAILQRSEVKPYLIVLYGSEARGEATPDSDIDLLVVLENDDPQADEAVSDAVYDVMWRHDFNRLISVLTFPRQRFEEQKRKGYSFIRNVERDGIVLWRAA